MLIEVINDCSGVVLSEEYREVKIKCENLQIVVIFKSFTARQKAKEKLSHLGGLVVTYLIPKIGHAIPIWLK